MVVRGEVSQRSKRLFKRMKVVFSGLHLFHLNQLRSVSWIMTQLRMQQQEASVCFAVSYQAEGAETLRDRNIVPLRVRSIRPHQ